MESRLPQFGFNIPRTVDDITISNKSTSPIFLHHEEGAQTPSTRNRNLSLYSCAYLLFSGKLWIDRSTYGGWFRRRSITPGLFSTTAAPFLLLLRLLLCSIVIIFSPTEEELLHLMGLSPPECCMHLANGTIQGASDADEDPKDLA